MDVSVFTTTGYINAIMAACMPKRQEMLTCCGIPTISRIGIIDRCQMNVMRIQTIVYVQSIPRTANAIAVVQGSMVHTSTVQTSMVDL